MTAETGIVLYSLVRPFFQPIIGAFHGWFATRMVVVMLFRPHKTYYFPGTQTAIPFTPGIFPGRKADLARNIATTVTQTLLTPADIKTQTDKLITEEHIGRFVGVVVDTMLEGFTYTDRIQQLAAELKKSVPGIFHSSVQAYLDKLLEADSPALERVTEYLVHDLLLNFRLSGHEAKELTDYVFRQFLAPQDIRTFLHEALTRERALNLQQLLRERTTGALRLVLSLVNIEGLVMNLKTYLQNEPEKSEDLIREFTEQLKIREEMIQQLAGLDFKKLSIEDIAALKGSLIQGLRTHLLENRHRLDRGLGHIEGFISETINQKILAFTPSQLRPEILQMIKGEISRFLYQYLKADLSRLINRGIAALKPGEMISGKIAAYTPADIEDLILGIMRRELANLEYLGLLIGLLLGISALAIEYFLPIR